MDDILEKYPEFENKLYIIGGSRREALREAMAILLRLTNRCCLSTEWFCLKDNEEQIKSTIDEVAAATEIVVAGKIGKLIVLQISSIQTVLSTLSRTVGMP